MKGDILLTKIGAWLKQGQSLLSISKAYRLSHNVSHCNELVKGNNRMGNNLMQNVAIQCENFTRSGRDDQNIH